MMSWTPARDREKYGVAIYNYGGSTDSCIKLNVGDTVHILEELGEWYFGYALHNKDLRGIFPKNYIQVRECIVDKSGPVEVVTARLPPIVQEVTAVLREWNILLRKLYLERNKSFNLLLNTMKELILHRCKVLSGQLPTDELRQLKHRITQAIDRVNACLGLDLVVRDDNGNILNPDITSAVKLFRHHDEAAAAIRKACSMKQRLEGGGHDPSAKKKPHLAWTAFISITNIIIKVPESSEISLGLYVGDPREGKERPLTETFIIPWTDDGYSHQPELLQKLKCLFTDLSSVVLEEGSLWLMGSVVRQGSMTSKEVDPRRTSGITPRRNTPIDSMRRPFGLILLDIKSLVEKQKDLNHHHSPSHSQREDHFASFYPCGEKETLDVKKLLSSRGDLGRDGKTGLQGIWFNFHLINGDIKKIQEDSTHLVELRDVPVAYRLGLSDVVMPGDVRNDLYVTLVSGEFSRGSKASDRNVEVTIRICDDKGRIIPGVIHQGCGKGPLDEYHSVTYHHDAKPKWAETFKIALPIEEFRRAHVKFLFKHRSTNDLKDKNEKPFALSYMKLMQPNGTTLKNTEHDLIVYKIDNKKWSEGDFSYLNLLWKREAGNEIVKSWNSGLSPSTKDAFTISTIFCSTKLTQNEELLRLLELGWSGCCWGDEGGGLEECLRGLRRVPADELMVFLQDTLDVLLEIMMNNSENEDSDNKTFEALIYVITIATDKNKHEAFQPVLDSYIQRSFHATLAYNKLIHVLKFYVENGSMPDLQETLKKAMKCLQYVFKFIIRSRQLFVELYGKGQQEFEKSLQQLLDAIADMMKLTEDNTLTVQAHCLKYITTTIPDIITTFDPVAMSNILVKMVNNLNPKRIPRQRLTTVNEVVHSELFQRPECRRVLLPTFISQIRQLLAAGEEMTDEEVVKRKKKTTNKLMKMLAIETTEQLPVDRSITEELDQCVKILGDILDVLFSSEVGPTYEDITQLSSALLEDIIAFVSKLNSEDPLLSKLVSVLVSLLRQMNERHFQTLFNQLTPPPASPTASPPNTTQLCCFLLSLMDVLDSLVKEQIFPKDWAEMILLQNSVVVKVLQQISRIISERVREPFKEEVWGHFFHTAINFITQPSLQLEGFTPSKRNKILTRYKDMRKETALEIKSLWFSLGSQKIKFVKGGELCMVGPFLKMTMLPGVELRKATIPIFFDMMQCEFYSPRESSSTHSSSNTQSDHPRPKHKFKFNEFESEMLEKLDELVESGHGDGHYREMFQELVGALCCEHNTMKEPGLKLVRTVTRLLERLLQYRTIMNTPDNSAETRMSCIVNLLDFYSEIKRKELYLRYVYKLSKLHLDCDNYTEAGYTLKLHTDLLRWTTESLSTALRSPLYPEVTQHGVLKEMLYSQIIDHFDKGKMWEDALRLCKELVEQYELVMMDYNKLADLLARMSNFYRSIMNPQNLRPEPEYFRVAYYGRGFPAFLQNMVFVYRGNGFERLADFTSRILDQFPNAELMKKLTPPSDDVKDSPQQFVQISKVDCAPEEDTRFLAPSVSEQIQKYYRAHHVKVFTFSRPFHRGHRDPNNEFATLCIEKTTLHTAYALPGILRCFPVVQTKSVELSPLENAIETMTTANTELYEITKRYARDSTLALHQLTRKVSGMVDAAVMGGIVNYEKAFLTNEYESSHPEDSEKLGILRQLISNQVPLLEAALFVHGRRLTDAEMALHNHMVTSFNKMQAQIQDKYGIGEMPEDLRVEKLRLQSQVSLPEEHSARGSYHYSSNDGMTLSGSQHSLSRLSAASARGGVGGTLPRQFKTSTMYGNGTGSTSSKAAKKESRALKNLLRRESFSSRESSTQWFQRCESVPPQPAPIVELTEQLTPQRPKRLEPLEPLPPRPRSFTFTSPPATPSPSLGSRESLASTPTGSVYEEDAPPPLPIKTRDQDNDHRQSSTLLPTSKGVPCFPLELPTDEPPKKPPRPDKNHNHQDPTLL